MNSSVFKDSLKSISRISSEFRANESYYLSPKYQEIEVRQDFIDKFWTALGWDVYHQQNINPYEREVRIEKNVMIDGRGKRADYAFFTAPNFSQAKFLAEAKKPSRNLENSQDCFQAIRYGWNSNTPISVLTDFEQFLILDSRYKPSVETSTDHIVKKFHYSDFTDEEKFSEIYFLFSREAVLQNSLEKFAKSLRSFQGARQTNLFNLGRMKPVDVEFLGKLDEYRLLLARAFKNKNPHLTSEELTEITQRTLDRLVLTRFLVDKVIEENEIVDNLGLKSGNAWADFSAEIRKLNSLYNGAIFRENILLDIKKIEPSEKEFEIIRDELAEKNSSYDFNLIPIHILGSIYERFLGNIIVVDGNRADITQKAEVRKAGGVYYTPEYIVRHIVENTIGRQIKGKTPEEISEMRFADIACGSGSFLLGVYDYLLKYHLNYYLKNKRLLNNAVKNGLLVENEGTLQLSVKYRRTILVNNIYGVDIDAQAIEVTKLSLYLKMLEEAKTGIARIYQLELGERLLPSLNENIIHGNSLIDYDVNDGRLFDTFEFKALNPMNFAQAFPEVFAKGGFDAVVGNPPYGADLTEDARQYLKRKFKVGTTDTAALMMIQAANLTKGIARIGQIVPKSFTYSSTWDKTRRNLIESLEMLVDTGKVWKEVKLEQVICVFDKGLQKLPKYNSLKRSNEEFDFLAEISKEEAINFGFYLNGLTSEEISIGRKLFHLGTYLGDVTKNTRGGMFQRQIVSEAAQTKAIGGKQVNRFFVVGEKGFVKNKKSLPVNSFIYPNDIIVQNIVAHIMNPVEHIKIIGAVIDDSHSEVVILDTVNRLSNFSEMSSYYLLALLHSKLINWYVYRFIFAKAIRTMHFDAPVSDKLPIKVINFNNFTEKSNHDKIVDLVKKVIEAKKSLASAQTDENKNFFERYCDSLNKQIDNLVYDLYELSDDEKKVIMN